MTPTPLPRAVVFDIYGTLLKIAPLARSEAEWRQAFGMTREDFQVRVRQEIFRRHEIARAAGIAYPEIQWPEVVQAVAPGMSPALAARFERRTEAQAGARELLGWLRRRALPLGLVSNAQAYTREELRECGIEPEWFPIAFLSYEQGFSKPDPLAFRWLAGKFAPIPPAEILVVGDRADNDILPALAAGFAAWQVTDAGLNPLLD
ncbi:MAG TPA: HAD family hydrolase, partial [Chthoniobacterales bacterium]